MFLDFKFQGQVVVSLDIVYFFGGGVLFCNSVWEFRRQFMGLDEENKKIRGKG